MQDIDGLGLNVLLDKNKKSYLIHEIRVYSDKR